MVKQLSPLNQYRAGVRGSKMEMVAPDSQLVGTGLVVPERAKFYGQALVLPPDFKEKDWEELGSELHKFHESLQWWWGDWWRFGDHTYGKRAATVARGILPHTFRTLMTYGWVCGRVSASIRIEELSFAHHQVVAPLDADKQAKWLQKAKKNKWSVSKPKKALAEHKDPRDDREFAESWAERALAGTVNAQLAADLCTITEGVVEHLFSEKIAELAAAIAVTASAWQRADAAISTYQERHKSGERRRPPVSRASREVHHVPEPEDG